VFLMEKGTIVHSGASHDLKSQPEIVHRYLGLSH
jgi:branched-chain amino acid transport system ATP-binding protein